MIMEEWQKQHIKKNLVQLVRYTNCNAHLISKFSETSIFASIDVQGLELAHLTPFEKSKKFYDLLVTRVGAYNVLLDALKETNQSGAVQILKQSNSAFQNAGKITFDKNHVVGRGMFGSKVYKGMFGERHVAVKALNADIVDLDISKREVDFLLKLDCHENIVRYFTVEISDNYVYIALEFCDISLEDEMKIRMVNMNPTCILRQCTSGLAHLHRYNVIHRDLKPANILLKLNQQVKISDFGLSKQIPIGATSVSITGVVGTVDWMAPEILKLLQQQSHFGETVKMTTSSDIFSLGCIFYFVLTNGFHPFGDILQRQFYIVQNSPQLTHHVVVNDLWLQLIKDMISHDAETRPSANQILSSDCFHRQGVNNQQHSSGAEIRRTLRSASPYDEHVNTPQKRNFENGSRKTQDNDNVSGTSLSKGQMLKRPKQVTLDKTLGYELLDAIESGETVVTIKNLIEHGADYMVKKHFDGGGVLHKAAEKGNFELVQYFDSFALCIHDRDLSGNTPLLKACYSGNLKIVKYLIDKGCRIKVTNERSMNLIQCAAKIMSKEDFHQLVSLLLEVYHATDLFTMKDERNETPLHSRIANNNEIETATIELIAAIPGIDMNTTNSEGNNMFHSAIRRGHSTCTMETLVKVGVNYEAHYRINRNTVSLAVELRNEQALNYLLSLGMNVNEADSPERLDIYPRYGSEHILWGTQLF